MKAKRIQTNPSDDRGLNELARKAMEAFEKLTPIERAAHRREQRISWVYGQMRLAGHNVSREWVAAIVDGRWSK